MWKGRWRVKHTQPGRQTIGHILSLICKWLTFLVMNLKIVIWEDSNFKGGTFRFWWVCNYEWKSERAERDISVWHWIHVLFVRLLDKSPSPRWYFIHKSRGPAIDLPINDKRRIKAQNHGVYITSTIRENMKHFERVRKRDGEGEGVYGNGEIGL